jgi:cation transport ATPase
VPDNKLSEVELDLPHNIEQLNVRMKHIEQIAQTVEMIAEKGFETAESYFSDKAEQEKLESTLDDKQHKRSVIVLFGVVFLIFILVMTAMLMKQFDLVKIILGSAFAIGSGAGIAGMFKKRTGER